MGGQKNMAKRYYYTQFTQNKPHGGKQSGALLTTLIIAVTSALTFPWSHPFHYGREDSITDVSCIELVRNCQEALPGTSLLGSSAITRRRRRRLLRLLAGTGLE